MASNLVVLDSSARRAVVKTTPTKHLSDVLQEACLKLRLDPSRYGLKNSAGKTLDLSQPIRLTGLSSGAKLQLLVLSKSPSAVSVALQLPDSETKGGPNRLTDRLASTTTLWILLRHFETVSKLNLTARGIPQTGTGQDSGSGRLYHESPVIHMMGKELLSFTDLQKTLSQLGLNSGSVLLRLSFRATHTPLEEAMIQIDEYFKSVEGETTSGVHASSVGNVESAPEPSDPVLDGDTDMPSPPESQPVPSEEPVLQSSRPDNDDHGDVPLETSMMSPSSPSEQTVTGPSQRPMTVYAPPSTTVPAATRHPHNERDYEPTTDHAKRHQSRLIDYGRNKTLPSDAELASQAEAQKKKVAEVKEVKIKVRFPDQSQVVSTFSHIDTATRYVFFSAIAPQFWFRIQRLEAFIWKMDVSTLEKITEFEISNSLYEFVKGLMHREDEPFSLNFSSPKGPKTVPKEGNNPQLISGLGMVGAVLVNVVWEEGASSEARGGKVLKEEFHEKATQIEVKEPEGIELDEKDGAGAKQKETSPKGKGKGGVPRWLKLPGKK